MDEVIYGTILLGLAGINEVVEGANSEHLSVSSRPAPSLSAQGVMRRRTGAHRDLVGVIPYD